MEPTQRTGQFTVAAYIRPGQLVTQLQALFHQMKAHLQEMTNDGRTYEYEVKIVANATVNPWDAEIEEYVHRDHFQPNLDTQDQVLESQDIPIEKRVFQPTLQGYQRIE